MLKVCGPGRAVVEFAAGHTCPGHTRPYECAQWDEVLKKKARVFIQQRYKLLPVCWLRPECVRVLAMRSRVWIG